MHSRRSFLQHSLALGAGGLLPMGWARSANAGTAKAPYLIVVVVAGGWDTTYCLDPKYSNTYIHGPDADNGGDDESIETYGTDLRVMVNDVKRPSVRTFFENYGTQSTVVAGLEVGSIAHRSGMDRMLTGTRKGTSSPDLAAIVGTTYGFDRPLACVDTCGQSRPGPLAASIGRLGAKSQIVALLDREDALFAPVELGIDYPQIVPTGADEEALDTYLQARASILEAKRASGGRNASHFANYRESIDRQAMILDHRAQFLDELRLGMSATHVDLSTLVANMFKDELCQTVIVESGQSWDTHEGNVNQHDSYEGLFALLNSMMAATEVAGIADETVIAVISELGRAPMLNDEQGKDHWPVTSALLVGPRIGSGRTLGGTSSELASLTVDLASGELDPSSGTSINYANFAAGLLQALDVDPQEWLPDTTPLRIVEARLPAVLLDLLEKRLEPDGLPQHVGGVDAANGRIVGAAVRGQHDDRDRPQVGIVELVLPERPSVHLGHHQIEEQDAGVLSERAELFERLPPVRGGDGRVRSVLEGLHDGARDVAIVVDHHHQLGTGRNHFSLAPWALPP